MKLIFYSYSASTLTMEVWNV